MPLCSSCSPISLNPLLFPRVTLPAPGRSCHGRQRRRAACSRISPAAPPNSRRTIDRRGWSIAVMASAAVVETEPGSAAAVRLPSRSES